MTLSDITVRTFMRCLFNKDFEGVGEENWEQLYTEYIDLSGMGETRQLELVIAIHNLQTRISFISGFIEFQKTWLVQFGEPFEQGFEDMKKFGYRLHWEAGYPTQFVDQLQKMETKEKRNIAELDVQMKELEEFTKTGKHKQKVNDRADFVRMLNTLGKEGYKIDKDKTDMEELSIMVRQHSEDIEALKNQTN